MAGTGDNMKNDHQYAEVLEMMRSQGAKAPVYVHGWEILLPR